MTLMTKPCVIASCLVVMSLAAGGITAAPQALQHATRAATSPTQVAGNTGQDHGPPSPASEAIHPNTHAPAPALHAGDTRPTLLEGYGNGDYPITTDSAQAQAYFTNGMVLAFAFAHKAAMAAMKESTRLDPACAMCLWGLAYTSGPTLNYDKHAKERVGLLKLARRAEKLARAHGSTRERDLTHALVTRFRRGNTERRDRNYADAMTRLARRYPADDTINVLAADAVLIAPTKHEERQPAGLKAMTLLEPVLARSPDNVAAIHFYIHASETAGRSAMAEPYADRLTALAPAASHLIHMPSHTWYWVGRYQDAADANVRAVKIDQANAARLGYPEHGGAFELPYHAHNVIFGVGGAMMAGDSRAALMLARPLIDNAQNRGKGSPFIQLYSAAGYFAVARFDDPLAVLALKEPKLPYLKAAWHFARGEAFAYEKDVAGVKAELDAIPATLVKGKVDDGGRAPEQLLGITRAVLRGRIAVLEGRWSDAIAAYREGATMEETPDFQRFSDPPAFWYPVRRDLAATLLASGDKPGAVREAEATLKLRPRDPATLLILAEAQATPE
jgi:tetratricopeptide (TPR) repeat protein